MLPPVGLLEVEAALAAAAAAAAATAAAAFAELVADMSKLSLSGEFRQVCIKAFPASDIIIGCNFRVAKV